MPTLTLNADNKGYLSTDPPGDNRAPWDVTLETGSSYDIWIEHGDAKLLCPNDNALTHVNDIHSKAGDTSVRFKCEGSLVGSVAIDSTVRSALSGQTLKLKVNNAPYQVLFDATNTGSVDKMLDAINNNSGLTASLNGKNGIVLSATTIAVTPSEASKTLGLTAQASGPEVTTPSTHVHQVVVKLTTGVTSSSYNIRVAKVTPQFTVMVYTAAPQ